MADGMVNCLASHDTVRSVLMSSKYKAPADALHMPYHLLSTFSVLGIWMDDLMPSMNEEMVSLETPRRSASSDTIPSSESSGCITASLNSSASSDITSSRVWTTRGSNPDSSMIRMIDEGSFRKSSIDRRPNTFSNCSL